MFPGWKSGFRDGFYPDSNRETSKIGLSAAADRDVSDDEHAPMAKAKAKAPAKKAADSDDSDDDPEQPNTVEVAALVSHVPYECMPAASITSQAIQLQFAQPQL